MSGDVIKNTGNAPFITTSVDKSNISLLSVLSPSQTPTVGLSAAVSTTVMDMEIRNGENGRSTEMEAVYLGENMIRYILSIYSRWTAEERIMQQESFLYFRQP